MPVKFKLIIILLSITCINAAGQLRFHDAAEFPLLGKAVDASQNRYVRLPDSLEHISRGAVRQLGQYTSGMALSFRSNSKTIAARWTNMFNNRMNHMTDTGVKGLDLYVLENGEWTFANSARPGFEKENQVTIIDNMDAADREYLLYLPLYDGIKTLEIGVDSTAAVSAPRVDLPTRAKPVVFYGTSILQGACASRPGMAFTNIISRRLNRETINLGFSGNAFLDYEIATLMAQADAGCFVLDFVPNTLAELIYTKMENFYRILRDAHPTAPIIFIEDPVFPHSRFDGQMAEEIRSKNEALRNVFDSLTAKGENDIHYIPSENMIGNDAESTIDGIHFTDVGMLRYSDLVCPVIKRLLGL